MVTVCTEKGDLMFEFQCEVCGKTKRVSSFRDVGRFCSSTCYGISMRKKKEPDPALNESECLFQPESIMCFERSCDRCGWNPKVAKARLDAYMGVNGNA